MKSRTYRLVQLYLFLSVYCPDILDLKLPPHGFSRLEVGLDKAKLVSTLVYMRQPGLEELVIHIQWVWHFFP